MLILESKGRTRAKSLFHAVSSRTPRTALLLLLAEAVGGGCSAADQDFDSPEDTDIVQDGFLKAAPVCVTLQRGLLGTVADASINQAEPLATSGASVLADVGYGGTTQRMALFRWSLEAIPPGATILSAYATVNQTSSGAGSPRVHLVLSPWSEGSVSYTSFGGAFYPPTIVTTKNTLPAMSFDLSLLVKPWVAGSIANNGILLEQDTSSQIHIKSSEWPVASLRPRLDICYQVTCAAGFADCDGNGKNGCETPLGTTANCSACGAGCASGSSCVASACVTPSPLDAGPGDAGDAGPGDAGAGDAGDAGATIGSSAATGHPRLWVRSSDVPRLAGWAAPSNPVFVELQKIADTVFIKGDLDNPATSSGDLTLRTVKQDEGLASYQADPTSEEYARLLAFLAVVSGDPVKRDDYAHRAHDLFMKVINAAAACPLPVVNSDAVPFCSSRFMISDRASFQGDAYATVLDWIYPTLSAAEKATTQKVFLRWADELTRAMTTSHNHPEPVGVVNDPELTSQTVNVRWAANNYFAAHMKNLGLLALALDPADDPVQNAALPKEALGNTVRSYLPIATGAYLYMIDYLYRNGGNPPNAALPGQDFRGSSPEGTGYGPSAMGFAAQLYLALHTTGRDDPALYGPQVSWATHPHWASLATAFYSSIEPSPSLGTSYVGQGSFYQVATHGEVNYEAVIVDPMRLFGPRGVWAYNTGNTAELNAIRFLEKNIPAGGAALMSTRLAKSQYIYATLDAIFAFLLFDPTAAAPALVDPRPSLPLVYDSPGLGRISARTGTGAGAGASWLTYKLGWNAIDHQLCDGNQVELYRKGQWLTKELSGYGPNVGLSHHHNTMALENSLPHDLYKGDLTAAGGVTFTAYKTGSAWPISTAGDPLIQRKSLGHADFLHVTGVATNLYNLQQNNLSASDIVHQSRSLVWLEPDHLVIYDRATSKTDGRFKRVWLNTPTLASIAGGVADVSTGSLADLGPAGTALNRFIGVAPPTGILTTALVHPAVAKVAGPSPEQLLYITTLLPAQVTVVASAREALGNEPLAEDPMKFALKIEATSGPKDARFLNVLQGADAGIAADPALLLQLDQVDPSQSPYDGVLVKNTVVLFARRLGEGFSGLSYTAPPGAKLILTGLPPSSPFTLNVTAGGLVTVTPGGALLSDSGGVLSL